MSGLWSGEYRYAGHAFGVRFSASIAETDGRFSGTTLEPGTFGPRRGRELEALIEGDRVGQEIWFSKLYAPESGIEQPPLLYSGAADTAFTLITGRWAFAHSHAIHGTFTMSRVSTTGAAAAARRRETVR